MENGCYMNTCVACVALWQFSVVWVKLSLSLVRIGRLSNIISMTIGALGVLKLLYPLHKIIYIVLKNGIKYMCPPSILSNGIL